MHSWNVRRSHSDRNRPDDQPHLPHMTTPPRKETAQPTTPPLHTSSKPPQHSPQSIIDAPSEPLPKPPPSPFPCARAKIQAYLDRFCSEPTWPEDALLPIPPPPPDTLDLQPYLNTAYLPTPQIISIQPEPPPAPPHPGGVGSSPTEGSPPLALSPAIIGAIMWARNGTETRACTERYGLTLRHRRALRHGICGCV